MFQNINSWQNKSLSLKEIYRKYDPEIILFAHTNRTNNNPPKFFPYKTFAINTARNASGVVLFIKPWLKYSPINHKFVSDTVAIKVETNTGPIIVAVNYTPPILQLSATTRSELVGQSSDTNIPYC